jgi:prepilin-type N-terminal cleavage/methylation domain-containing protein/prepilin-type processing-associated H-X9-DG protein
MRSSRHFRRSAFTLVELLVVIAIIGILVMMMLPAVTMVRGAARRVQCQNNLKQLSLAVLAYEEGHASLPPSGIVAPSATYFDPQSGPMLSWAVCILPYVEQKNLADRFNLAKSVLEQPDDPQEAQLAVLLCPDDGAKGRYFTDPQLTRGKRFGKGNYAAFVSPVHVDLQYEYPGALGQPGRRMEDIRDGATKTLLLSEVRTRDVEGDQRGAWALPWAGSSLLAFDMHPNWNCLPGGVYTPNPYWVGITQPPNCQGPNEDMLYACPDMGGSQIDRMPCAKWEPSGEWCFLSAAPRSLHAGGVNAVFADGHVTFLPNNIDEITMACLVSAYDGQSPETSSFEH